MFFSRKLGENAQCRYCKRVSENEGVYICEKKGAVEPSFSCRLYKFDPFAKREKRRRSLDTSTFDPLDFEI